MSMTGNMGFSTIVVFVTIMDRGSHSRSFRSRMSAAGGWAPTEPMARKRTVADASRVRMESLRGGGRRPKVVVRSGRVQRIPDVLLARGVRLEDLGPLGVAGNAHRLDQPDAGGVPEGRLVDVGAELLFRFDPYGLKLAGGDFDVLFLTHPVRRHAGRTAAARIRLVGPGVAGLGGEVEERDRDRQHPARGGDPRHPFFRDGELGREGRLAAQVPLDRDDQGPVFLLDLGHQFGDLHGRPDGGGHLVHELVALLGGVVQALAFALQVGGRHRGQGGDQESEGGELAGHDGFSGDEGHCSRRPGGPARTKIAAPFGGLPVSRHFAALPALLLALPLAPAAPQSKEKERSPAYHPTAVGARWVYEYNGREVTWEVTQVEVKDEETQVTVSEVTDGRLAPLEKVAITPKGLFRSEVGGVPVSSWCILKFPVREGTAWEFEFAPQRGLVGQSGTTTVGKTEEVEIPAGKFTAVRVEMVVTVRNGARLDPPIKSTTWFDPGIGVVKSISDQGSTRVLKSFTPGKK